MSDPDLITSVSDDERDVLLSARRDGVVSAHLYRNGDFDEAGFTLFGRLEAMCRKGLLRFVERRGDAQRRPEDVRMTYTLAEGA